MTIVIVYEKLTLTEWLGMCATAGDAIFVFEMKLLPQQFIVINVCPQRLLIQRTKTVCHIFTE